MKIEKQLSKKIDLLSKRWEDKPVLKSWSERYNNAPSEYSGHYFTDLGFVGWIIYVLTFFAVAISKSELNALDPFEHRYIWLGWFIIMEISLLTYNHRTKNYFEDVKDAMNAKGFFLTLVPLSILAAVPYLLGLLNVHLSKYNKERRGKK